MRELEKIARLIKENDSFFITSHIRPDGDSIGSQLALKRILEELGKKVTILNHDPVSGIHNFLPGRESIRQELPRNEEFDIAFVLDSPDLSRLGSTAKVIKKAKIVINIDHHPGNKNFGKYNYVDTRASAVGEEIYELSRVMGFKIDGEIALCLYVGIVTDTGSFTQSNTTSKTHEITADLIRIGRFSPARIFRQLYETRLPSTIKLLGLTLSTLKLSPDGRVAWMAVTQEMFKEAGAGIEETDDFIRYARLLKGSEVALFFTEISREEIKVNFRSKGRVDVNKIASSFGGGGHLKAAACTIKGDLKKVQEKVLAEAEKRLKRIYG